MAIKPQKPHTGHEFVEVKKVKNSCLKWNKILLLHSIQHNIIRLKIKIVLCPSELVKSLWLPVLAGLQDAQLHWCQPSTLCFLHKGTEHGQHSQPKAPDRYRLNQGTRIAPAQLWQWRMPPLPGIIRQEAAPELWVPWCSAKSERGSGCTERAVQRKLLLPSGSSPAAAQESELHPQKGSHVLVPQTAIPDSSFVSPDCRNPMSPSNHRRIPYPSLQNLLALKFVMNTAA